jgi:predicted ATPase
MRSDNLSADGEHSVESHLTESSFSIDGFRSLRDFEITLCPGLNVLVGPNGSGKTNYIDFMSFLDASLRMGVSSAISSVGGISRVFSIENIRRASPKLTAKICGLAELQEHHAKGLLGRYFRFEYEIIIRFSRENSAVYISKEWVKFRKLWNPDNRKSANTTVGTLSITRSGPSEDAHPRWHIGGRLLSRNGRNPFAAESLYYKNIPDSVERLTVDPLPPDQSLLSTTRFTHPTLDAVRIALIRGRAFNIVPDKAREPDDLTRNAIISRDGGGLSATLHALQLARRGLRKNRSIHRRIGPESMDMAVAWTRLVFPEMADIQVAQDPHTGKYLGHIVISTLQHRSTEERALRIPLQACSDGTLKWLCFVCLIITSGGIYSFEEPENFLHPRMQQALVKLIRESFEGEEIARPFIISTHSESLINECAPEELIIFQFRDHATSCHRISNPNTVREEINKTGFGLGYYYASNAVS